MTADASDRNTPGKPRPARPSKPTPVRALEDAPPTRKEGPGPPPERVTLQVDDRPWTVEAVGHAEAAAGASILLVRFTQGAVDADAPGEADSVPADPAKEPLEAWVVGTRLADVPHARLVEALARAGPWRGSETNAPFFADEGGRRGR